MRALIALLALGSGLAACAPANVAGTYNGNVTNGASTCPGNWTTGSSSTVSFVVAQSGGNVTVDVQGVAGGLLQLWAGSHVFAGTVGGSTINATLVGTTQQTTGNCHYTIRADLQGTLSGNTLEGTVTYRPSIQAPESPDCVSMAVTGCMESQSFNGLRPPPSP